MILFVTANLSKVCKQLNEYMFYVCSIEPDDSSKMLEYLLVNLEGNHSHEDLPFKDPDSYLEHILDQSTSCPNTTGVEWYTVLDEVKDFVLACEGYIKVMHF